MMAACVGRDRELHELIRRCAATVTDGVDIVAVVGEPGVGKSRFLRLLVEHYGAATTGCARWAQALAWESDVPAALLSQLLQEPVPDDPVTAAAAVAERMRDAGPTLLVIDDAEYADILSLQALASTIRHHRDLPLMVVLSMTARQDVLADIVTSEIRLCGLDTPAIAELAASRGRNLHPAMADALARHTRGNPRDILALLDELTPAAWAQPGSPLPAPDHVVSRVRAQLAGCAEDGRHLVEALAVLGDEGSLAEATVLAGLDDPMAAIDAASSAGLLADHSEFEPRLHDPLVRAAVIELQGGHRSGEAHRRAAGIVVDPVRRLGHRVAASPLPDAALADGAEGAWAQAAVLLRDASRLTAEPLLHAERLTRAVDALIAAGNCIGAAALVPTVESLRETPLRNAVLAYLAILRGRATEADVRLQRAWDITNSERDPGIAALIAQRHVLHWLVHARGSELVEWADRALELADPESPAGIESAAIRGLGLLAAGQPQRAAAAYDDLVGRVRYGAQAQRVVMGRGWVQFIGDDIDGARSSLESAVAMAGLGGSTRITLWALAWLARVQFSVGDWDQALDSVEHGRTLAASSGIVLTTPLLEWTAAHVHALRGSWMLAEQAVQSAVAITGDYEMMQIPTILARAQVAEADADYPKMRRILAPLTRLAPGTSLLEPGYWPWPDMVASAMALTGQLDAADEFLRPHEQLAATRGHRSAQARLALARGRVLGAQGDIHGSRRSFEAALDLLEGLPLRYETARVSFAYGQTLRRAGKRRQADTIIGTARELYLALGAQTYVARCDRELKAGGVHVERRARGQAGLTPQEEAVTSLVAQGLSNREVAAELYVSPKTVRYHLTRIYAKLGVRSRAELVALRR